MVLSQAMAKAVQDRERASSLRAEGSRPDQRLPAGAQGSLDNDSRRPRSVWDLASEYDGAMEAWAPWALWASD